MTKAQDIQELIADQSSGPGERKAMEAMAEALDESLTRAVPFRSEFKAQLRQQLMAEARRTLTPWYRRPAVWGSSMGVAAAAAVLAVGLQLYHKAPAGPQGPATPPVAQQQPGGPGVSTKDTGATGHLVSNLQLPVVNVPDEIIPSGKAAPAPESIAGLDLSQGLKVLLLVNQPDMAQFGRMAAGLGFTQQVRHTGADFTVTEGSKSLYMTADGHVTYSDRSALQDTGAVADAGSAPNVARRFLDSASLPVPDLQPAVGVGPEGDKQVYTITYTPRVEGRPVVNARTVITVTDRSRVLRAEAYAYAMEQPKGLWPVITPDQAVAEAAKRGGGRFGQEVDLVYVRTISDQAVYVQPYWRVFGTADKAGRLLRYVPALAPKQ